MTYHNNELRAALSYGSSGSPTGNRTPVTAVKGPCLNRLTMGPKNRRRPTFPGSFPPSIIGAKELNYCVRDGNRCNLNAIVTRYSIEGCTFKTKQCFVKNHWLLLAPAIQASLTLAFIGSLSIRLSSVHASLSLAFSVKDLGQVLDLLVSVSSTCRHAYTSDLSTW